MDSEITVVTIIAASILVFFAMIMTMTTLESQRCYTAKVELAKLSDGIVLAAQLNCD
jgi:hypothetical protein